ncbi:MAG: tetratricopeptide repeat protein [Candidatus Cloacimonadales bacterium]|nr:tetratricopeptide repeat protein [Candidatus Cloacimonadales bacterium]
MIKKIFFLFLLLITSNLLLGQNSVDSLKTALNKAVGTNRVKILNSLSAKLIDSSLEESRTYIDLALKEAKENSREKVQAFYNLGIYFKEQAEFDSAFDNFQFALQLAEQNNFKELLPRIHNGLGIVWYKRSDFDQALRHYRKAVNLAIEINAEEANTPRLLNIGKIYYYQGDFNNALLYYQKAAENSEQFSDEIGNANASKEMGTIYNRWQKYPEAKEYYLKAQQIYENLGDLKQTSIVLNELGIISRNEKDYSKAIEYQEKSLKIKEKIGYKYGIAASLNGLGISYKNLRDYQKALEYYQRAVNIQREISDEMGVAATISNIGLVYQAMGNNEEALKYFLESNEMARNIGYSQLIINNLQAISDVYSRQKNFEQSLLYFSRSVALKDSVFNEEKHKQFAEMQTKYETVKKEKENEQLKHDLVFEKLETSRQKAQRNFLLLVIVLILVSALLIYIQYRLRTKAFLALQKANEVIMEQKKELEIMNKTRNRFFSIIAHDLRNSIGSTQMGVELLEDIEELDKAEMSLVLEELKGSVENLANLLENLLEWARIQIGRIHVEPVDSNLAEILDDVLLTLKTKLEQKNLNLISDIPPSALVFADRNMIYSILQNLLSNAIKFSLEKGEIIIRQKIDDKNIEISISDNGIGISEDKLSRLFRVDEIVSTPGTNSEKGTGLGLILCKEFVEKNGGEISLESTLTEGTTVRFTLPKMAKI